MKGWQAGGESVKTQFKKGEKPMNYKPIGSEVIDADGYIRIKVVTINDGCINIGYFGNRHTAKSKKDIVWYFLISIN